MRINTKRVNNFVYISYVASKVEMSSRENLSKLKVGVLKNLALENGLTIAKKKKEELINDILIHQAPLSALTPVRSQVSVHEALYPDIPFKENLPPFNSVQYRPVTETDIPSINFKNIYDFMVNRQLKSGGQVNNFKGMDKAVRHFDAGDIQDISVYQVDDSTYYIKAFCLASMKKQRYQVYVCLGTDDNKLSIAYGYCQCPIGMGQACSHIGGLLFALSKANGIEAQVTASTSKICRWNVPRQNIQPKPISCLSNKKPRLDKKVPEEPVITNFDPRHSLDKLNDTENKLTSLQNLKLIFPNTGMSHLWCIPDPVPVHINEVEVETFEDPMIRKMRSLIITKGNVPPLSIEQDLVDFIELNTRDQRQSNEWIDLHIGRITSSVFARVLRAGSNPNSLVKDIVEGSSLNKYTNLPVAVQWGIENEAKAKEDYLHLQSALKRGTNFRVEPTGLTLCSSHSFLGASSDGRVIDGEDHGVLEIKCPYSIEGIIINKMQIIDIIKLNPKAFLLENSSEGIRLKKNHPYYTQIQGEMAILGLPWCDFVVWTDASLNNICIDRVYFDIEYVQNMLPRLVEFYVKYVLPEFEP